MSHFRVTFVKTALSWCSVRSKASGACTFISYFPPPLVARSPFPNTYVSRDSLVKIYTGQGVPPGVAGEGGIRADSGEPRRPEDKILLWNAIRASRVSCKGERRREGRGGGQGDGVYISRVAWYFLTFVFVCFSTLNRITPGPEILFFNATYIWIPFMGYEYYECMCVCVCLCSCCLH